MTVAVLTCDRPTSRAVFEIALSVPKKKVARNSIRRTPFSGVQAI